MLIGRLCAGHIVNDNIGVVRNRMRHGRGEKWSIEKV
jgi:hypothetical protein